MTFTVSDFSDLKHLLAENPQWQVELRRLLLSEDFEALPGMVRDLVDAQRDLADVQRRHEERLAHIEDRLTRLEEAVAQLVEVQRRHEERLARVEERLEKVEQRLEKVEVRLGKVEDKLGELDGRTLEAAYRDKAPSYFGRWLRRAEAMTVNDLDDVVEERLTSDEWDEVLLTDLLVRGRVRHRPHKPEVWLVVEISAVMDREDVARALRRTELLRRAGLIALPAVAGKTATEGAQTQARTLGVAMLQDGTGWHWEETLAAWLS